MGYFDAELAAQLQLVTEICSKLFRIVIRIVDVPLELIFQDDVVVVYVQLQHSYALFFVFGLVGSMSCNRLLDRVCNLLLVRLQLAILFNQQSTVVFWCHIWLIDVPEEGSLEFLAFHFEIQMDRDQYFRKVQHFLFEFERQGTRTQLVLHVVAAIQSRISRFVPVQVVQPL